MLEAIIVVLLIFWLLGATGAIHVFPAVASGNLFHVLLVVALVIIVIRLVRGQRL